ncbi:MAG: hypothetical protein ACXAE3_11825 [Candidatus Kariarchaeaceae archaeon]|jgi:hypothetical protein
MVIRLSITLPSLMEFKGTAELVLEPDASLTEFIQAMEKTAWGSELVEDGRIKAPFGLVINGELVMLKSAPTITFDEATEIRIIPLLSGG